MEEGRNKSLKKKIVPLVLLGFGVFVLVQVFLPVAAFQIWSMTSLNKNALLVDPVSTQNVLGISIENQGDFPALISNATTDAPYQNFSLSIPKLNLSNLNVKVASNTFDNNLAQLPGTALPGEKGNVFISGHSSLAEFYKPGNYKAIFTHLPELGVGDQILVTANGVNFTYVVEGLRVVDPGEIWVVYPPDPEGRYLSLMTCVPPGLTTKRLVVLARLMGT